MQARLCVACPAECRRAAIDGEADKKLREARPGMGARYEIRFLEMGAEPDHARFPVQSAPAYSRTDGADNKGRNGKKTFESCPGVKKTLWGGEFWTGGFYVGAVGDAEAGK
ncbi:MAG: transposase [Treponema sp.]|nr:transposase [Treponema sp.]